jgi:hypothetical protein
MPSTPHTGAYAPTLQSQPSVVDDASTPEELVSLAVMVPADEADVASLVPESVVLPVSPALDDVLAADSLPEADDTSSSDGQPTTVNTREENQATSRKRIQRS